MAEHGLPHRSEVPTEQTWDITSVYPSDAAWETAFQDAEAGVETLARFAGVLGESSETLLAALRTRDTWQTTGWRLRQYASMQVKADATDAAAAARLQRANGLRGRINAALAYIEPELLALDPARLDALVDGLPDLVVYRHYLDVVRRRQAHVRQAEIEAILSGAEALGTNAYQTYKTLVNGDLRFGSVPDRDGREVVVAASTIHQLLRQPDRALRRAVCENYAGAHYELRNTFAGLLATAVERDVLLARARGYPAALDAALDASYLPRAVFTTLLETCRAHLPLWHRYFEIRRRALGVERLQPCDLDVPLVRAPVVIPYDEARELILAAVAPLGPDYGAVLRRGLYEERWVDWGANRGKLAGAEQSGAYGTRPFVLLTYDDTIISVSALAHELGHAMHAYYTWQAQPPVYDGFADYLSETASTFHQALLRAHLLKLRPDPDFQLVVLAEALAYYERYLLGMPLLAQLEWEAHERCERGAGVSADWLCGRMLELQQGGFGPAVALDDPRASADWATFPHLYLNFYVYQYTLGLAAANALADAVLTEGEPAAARYRALLAAGDSLYPLDALRQAGVDLTSPAPVERAFAVLASLLDHLDALVGAGPLTPHAPNSLV